MHSTPYNNLTLFNLTANTGEAPARGFAVFPASEAPTRSVTTAATPAASRAPSSMGCLHTKPVPGLHVH